MQITKLSNDISYSKICHKVVFDINGKKVTVYSWNEQDNEADVYDGDTNIDETDLKALSDEEYEAIGENLTELLETEIGQITNI